jgi:AcrR family transcriptional regulator
MIHGVAASTDLEPLRGRTWRSASSPGQRRRLLQALTHLAIAEGYGGLTVAQIVAQAGVSRPTFYECFGDREACFAAALAPVAEQVLGGVRQAVARAEPERALYAAAQGLLAYARSQPARARLLLSDTLAGGSRLRDLRDALIDEAAQIVEQAHAQLPIDAVLPGTPPRLVLGTVCRMVASRLRGGAHSLSELAEGLPGWIGAYEMTAARQGWRALATLAPPARSPFLPPVSLAAPPVRRSGTRRPERAVVEDQWLRIVFATAEVIRRDGCADATVAQITATAGVDARAFYRLFASKQQALAAGNELLFRHAMAAAAGAFVAGRTWPERVWEAARALAQYAEESPTLTYVSLIESCGGDADEGGRLEGLAHAFTIFLHEGRPHPGAGSDGLPGAPSELAIEAIGAGILELGYRHVSEAGAAALSSLLGPIVFVCLAPFLGAQHACEFVCRDRPAGGAPADLASAA